MSRIAQGGVKAFRPRALCGLDTVRRRGRNPGRAVCHAPRAAGSGYRSVSSPELADAGRLSFERSGLSLMLCPQELADLRRPDNPTVADQVLGKSPPSSFARVA